jgi:hypothetical protein
MTQLDSRELAPSINAYTLVIPNFTGGHLADHLVKLVHARDLARWERFPAYERHTGKTLAQHRGEVKAREDLGSELWRLIEAKRIVDGATLRQFPLSLYRRSRFKRPSVASFLFDQFL